MGPVLGLPGWIIGVIGHVIVVGGSIGTILWDHYNREEHEKD